MTQLRLRELSLLDFRNIASARFSPGPRATVVVGRNGQGKTNLLEAIYLLATLRPLRATRLAELVRFGCERSEVRGTFEVRGAVRDFGVVLDKGERQAFVGGKKVEKLDEYFGGVSVVAFTPDDLAIVKGGPETRRRTLDRAVFGRFPSYLAETRAYLRALRARNRLLRDQAAREVVEAFDGPVAQAGAVLAARRRTLVHELQPAFERALAAVTQGQLHASLRYAPVYAEGAAGPAEIALRLRAELVRRLEHDRHRGHTSIGPHADALGISVGGRPARAYASQGQQRALVLALKIAEIENLKQTQGSYPLLLLDDVSSELDRERNEQLMGYLAGLDGQVLLTTTEPSLVRSAVGSDAVFLYVREGEIRTLAEEPENH